MTVHTLKGKNVLVAAGAKNLGGLISRQAADAGANVAIHYNSDSTRPDAEATLAAVEAAGGRGVILSGETQPGETITVTLAGIRHGLADWHFQPYTAEQMQRNRAFYAAAQKTENREQRTENSHP